MTREESATAQEGAFELGSIVAEREFKGTPPHRVLRNDNLRRVPAVGKPDAAVGYALEHARFELRRQH
eukprot:654554-Prymnesium_polylepis.1